MGETMWVDGHYGLLFANHIGTHSEARDTHKTTTPEAGKGIQGTDQRRITSHVPVVPGLAVPQTKEEERYMGI